MLKKKNSPGKTAKKESEWYQSYCTECSNYFTAVRVFGEGSKEADIFKDNAIRLQGVGEKNGYSFPLHDGIHVKLR